MTDRPDVETLRRLEAEATPGRWYHLIDDYGGDGRAGTMFLTHEAVLNNLQTPLAIGLCIEDADFIAAFRNDAAALLARVEELEEALTNVRDGYDAMTQSGDWMDNFDGLHNALVSASRLLEVSR